VAKIILDVNDENLGAVITVLNSLREGLISHMKVSSKTEFREQQNKKEKFTRYQPKTQRVIYENEQENLKSMGKYIDPAEFKKRLKRESRF